MKVATKVWILLTLLENKANTNTFTELADTTSVAFIECRWELQNTNMPQTGLRLVRYPYPLPKPGTYPRGAGIPRNGFFFLPMSGDAKGRAGPVETFPPPGPEELLVGFLEGCFTAALDMFNLPLQRPQPEVTQPRFRMTLDLFLIVSSGLYWGTVLLILVLR